jgi:hypothetical protein
MEVCMVIALKLTTNILTYNLANKTKLVELHPAYQTVIHTE